ncbi:MAG TPA: hypothetical protein VGA56_26440 [Opitutaceae bacterium]
MIELPIKISSILAYSVTLTLFVVVFISARYAVLWARRRDRKEES